MRIVHVVRQFKPSIGGMEEVVWHLSNSCKEEGGEVEIITLNRLFTDPVHALPKTEIMNRLVVKRISYFGTKRYPIAPNVLKHIAQADIIHVHGIDFFYDFLALTQFFHRKVLVVSTHGAFFHTNVFANIKKIWFQTITRFSAYAYKRVIATSDNDYSMFAKILPKSKLTVIENGVDIDKFYDRGSVKSGKTLIYFGRWSMNKGLLEILDVLKALVAIDNEWNLILAGKEYDYTCAFFMRQISDRSLGKNVQLFPSPSDSELKNLIHQSHFFICLSDHEGFGIAVIESMSAGLIPILSAIPPFKKIINQSHVGIVVDKTCVDTSICAMMHLSRCCNDNWLSLRQRAIAFSHHYKWEMTAKKYFMEYQTILRSQKLTFI